MIRIADDGAVRVITLSRAEKRNALTPQMLTELVRAVHECPAAARVLVLAGDGAAFCAGFDLALCAGSPDGSVMRELLAGLSAFIAALREWPGCVVVAAHGAAIAGGCAMLGGADVVVADRGAKFGYPVLTIGVSPAVSGPAISTKMGYGQTRARMLDTSLIDGLRALEIGLVHEVVAQPGEVRDRAMGIARALAEKPPTAIAATRRWMKEIEDGLGGADGARALAASMGLTGGEEEGERIRRAVSR